MFTMISSKLGGHHHFASFKSSIFFFIHLFLFILSHFFSIHSPHFFSSFSLIFPHLNLFIAFCFFQCCTTYVVAFFSLTLLLSRLHYRYCCILFSSCVASNLATNILCFFFFDHVAFDSALKLL